MNIAIKFYLTKQEALNWVSASRHVFEGLSVIIAPGRGEVKEPFQSHSGKGRQVQLVSVVEIWYIFLSSQVIRTSCSPENNVPSTIHRTCILFQVEIVPHGDLCNWCNSGLLLSMWCRWDCLICKSCVYLWPQYLTPTTGNLHLKCQEL